MEHPPKIHPYKLCFSRNIRIQKKESIKICLLYIFRMTKRPHRSEKDGKYHIKGKTYPELFGSRVQVFRGNAYKTLGNLVKSDLLKNKHDRIVSKKKYFTAKKEKRLLKHGYGFEKGKFGYKKMGTRKNRKMRGGMHELSPAPFDGAPAVPETKPVDVSKLSV